MFRNILVIRRDGIGDMVNTTPALTILKRNNPGAKLTVACRSAQAELLKGNPDVDRTIVLRSMSAGDKVNFLRQIRHLRPDLAVAIQRAYLCNLAAVVSGAGCKIGWKGKRFAAFLDIRQPYSYFKGEVHETSRNLSLIRRICDDVPEIKPRIVITESEKEKAISLLESTGLELNRFWCAIHPGASSVDRVWIPEKYAEIADRLADEYGAQVVILFGPTETMIARSIAERMSHRAFLVQPTDIRMLAALIDCAPFLLCNDSGPMHIGAALNTPLLALFGPGDYVRWRPLSDHAQIVRQDLGCFPCSVHKCRRGFECMKSLETNPVWQKITEMMPLTKKQFDSTAEKQR